MEIMNFVYRFENGRKMYDYTLKRNIKPLEENSVTYLNTVANHKICKLDKKSKWKLHI